jgi:hypothetical protein
MREAKKMVKQAIVDSYGSYVVTYHPGPTARACRRRPKIEIKLPGTEYRVIIGHPIRPGRDSGIVIVNPSGAVTNIPVYKDDSELLNAAGQTRDGLCLATIFVPIVVPDDAPPVRGDLRYVKKHRAGG